MRILVIDNYDSFVHNLVQYLQQLGADVECWRNDDPRLTRTGWHTPVDGVLLSPGPGTPERAGGIVELVRDLAGVVPLFGVCLGMQAMAVAFGGRVVRAPEPGHGQGSGVHHDATGVFRGLPSPLKATRYHSLAVTPDDLPPELEIHARSATGLPMALRHRSLPVEGVQFHPESILSERGHGMLANWLATCGDADAPRRAADLAPAVPGPR